MEPSVLIKGIEVGGPFVVIVACMFAGFYFLLPRLRNGTGEMAKTLLSLLQAQTTLQAQNGEKLDGIRDAITELSEAVRANVCQANLLDKAQHPVAYAREG